MEVLLDSNFIISCVKRKINYINELESLGFKVVLPKEIFQELKDLRLKVPHDDRVAIDLALKKFNSEKIKKIKLGNKNVDKGLIQLGKKGAYIATLDSAIKRSVPNKVVISDAKNSLVVERA